MPELPEVETIRKDLEKTIINKTIIKVNVYSPQLIKRPDSDQFVIRLQNSLIQEVQRKGKYLLFFLNTNDYFIIHLGMSGQLLYQDNQSELPRTNKKHDHILFLFTDGSQLVYNDVRKFGKMWLLSKEKRLPAIELLGLDPLAPEFSFEAFFSLFKTSHRNIKSLMMNQRKIAGIGNIYANEILFLAGIHPLRKVDSLTKKEAEKLFSSIRIILFNAIQLRGTTMVDKSYRDLEGNWGKYEKALMVYGKRKGKCPYCGQPLKVIHIENRSTFYCCSCQK